MNKSTSKRPLSSSELRQESNDCGASPEWGMMDDGRSATEPTNDEADDDDVNMNTNNNVNADNANAGDVNGEENLIDGEANLNPADLGDMLFDDNMDAMGLFLARETMTFSVWDYSSIQLSLPCLFLHLLVLDPPDVFTSLTC